MADVLMRGSAALHEWSMPATALGVSFSLSLLIAWFYTHLHGGMPYGRTFAQSLAVAGVLSALIVLSIGDSIARGIGLVGAVTLVRFRSNLKDPRDLIFAFAALGAGVAAGAHAFFVAIFGTTLFVAGLCAVSRPWFGRGGSFDAILSLRTLGEERGDEALARELGMRCDRFAVIRVRQADGGAQEHAYQVVLKHPADRIALVRAVERIPGVEDAQLVVYDHSQDL